MFPSEKQIINTEKAPKALGPYTVANQWGKLVFTSGQVGLDPVSNTIVEGGIEAETRQVFANLTAVLAAAGTSLKNVLKTTVFMRDIAEFARMNAVYAEHFAGDYPARSTVQVAALPKNAAVEIEVVAFIP